MVNNLEGSVKGSGSAPTDKRMRGVGVQLDARDNDRVTAKVDYEPSEEFGSHAVRRLKMKQTYGFFNRHVSHSPPR